MEVARAESNMADALSAKNSEIETLTSSMDALKKQSAGAEEKLASLQVVQFCNLEYGRYINCRCNYFLE